MDHPSSHGQVSIGFRLFIVLGVREVVSEAANLVAVFLNVPDIRRCQKINAIIVGWSKLAQTIPEEIG